LLARGSELAKNMSRTLGVIFACLSSVIAAKDELTLTMIRRSVQAMGGEKVLRGLHSLEIKGIGHRYMREQSQRPYQDAGTSQKSGSLMEL
jgi:hypothetical protein